MKRIKSAEIQQYEKDHEAVMRRIAPECMVLLRSDGSFPVRGEKKIALYGNGARHTIKGGTGSGDVNVRHFVTAEEGFRRAGVEITTKGWLDAYDKIREDALQKFVAEVKQEAEEKGVPAHMLGMGRVMGEPAYELPLEGEGDTAVYVLARTCGEGADRTDTKGDIRLTDTERRDILALNKKYPRFLLVLNVGGMVDLSELAEVKNMLLLGQLGTVTGDALVDVVLGKSYPSGKLTATWAAVETFPSTANFGDPDDTYYEEGIYVGYRYFDREEKEVQFPFGYGLGYTTFSIADAKTEEDDTSLTVQAIVKNTGTEPGKETVQVYIGAPCGKLDQPLREVRGFTKTKELQPGEAERITISIPKDRIVSYSEERNAWIREPGVYTVFVGPHPRDLQKCGTMEVKTLWVKEQKQEDHSKQTDEKTQKFLDGLTDRQLAYLCIGAYKEGGMTSVIGNAGQRVAGAAGETTAQLADQGVQSILMADGPAGLRLSRKYILDGEKAQGLESFMPANMLIFLDEAHLEMLKKLTGPSRAYTEDELYYQYCTAIPVGMSIAQSWNEEAVQEIGDVVGAEMEQFGIQLWLAPALNIYRSPLCGRNFEYYSEDPLISGVMAACMTEGVQRHPGCGTTIKHFACNNQETNRYFSNSHVGERALREIYLKGFELCVRRAQPKAVMTSFNLLNGEHTCSDRRLLTDLLRNEWGFAGIVMTDWLVTGGMGKAGNKYPCASAAGCIRAGNDLIMPGEPSDMEDILDALKDPTHPYALERKDLEQCAARVLQMVQELTKE